MLLRTQQAASYVGVTVGFLRRLVKAGQLRVVQPTRRSPFWFSKNDLDRWLATAKR